MINTAWLRRCNLRLPHEFPAIFLLRFSPGAGPASKAIAVATGAMEAGEAKRRKREEVEVEVLVVVVEEGALELPRARLALKCRRR